MRVQLMREVEQANRRYGILDKAFRGDDLEPGVYEGGFKTWECAVDLAAYLMQAVDSGRLDLAEGNVHVVEVRPLRQQGDLKATDLLPARSGHRPSYARSVALCLISAIGIRSAEFDLANRSRLQRCRADAGYRPKHPANMFTECTQDPCGHILSRR